MTLKFTFTINRFLVHSLVQNRIGANSQHPFSIRSRQNGENNRASIGMNKTIENNQEMAVVIYDGLNSMMSEMKGFSCNYSTRNKKVKMH